MGLCKCPKKKVTNLFCFEHRVNVCEHCLVANHEKCVVQSYLQWLQDSDYDPTCRLCGKNLNEDTRNDCSRLLCYDVFHWSCLDQYCRQMPANTAPAGYTCPLCKNGIFPAANLVSPVAEKLRQFLSRANWARAGLGLPLLDESATVGTRTKLEDDRFASSTDSTMLSFTTSPAKSAPAEDSVAVHSAPAAPAPRLDSGAYARGDKPSDYHHIGRGKVFDTRGGEQHLNMSSDHDDDKYKRRPALQWLLRWFNSRAVPTRRDPNASMKRFAILAIVGIIAFLTLVVIFSRVGRASADDDPLLDPMANPNIQVGVY